MMRPPSWFVGFWLAVGLLLVTSVSQAAVCVQADMSNAVYIVQPQPADWTVCGMVLATPAELQEASPFLLTVEQGAEIGITMLLVFAVAWGFRVLVRAINVDSNQEV